MVTPTARGTRTNTDRGVPDRNRPPFAKLCLALLLTACTPGNCAPARGPVDPGTPADPRPGFVYGRVTLVYDGDSLAMRTTDELPLQVRLAEIDTPEKGMPYANRARSELRRLVGDRDIAVRRFDIDRYNRLVGRVFVAGVDVNAELVRQGLAVVYCRFAKDPVLYELEEQARAAGRGVWSGDRLPRGACRDPAPAPPDPGLPPGCGNKQYCREMSSCEEALFYLNRCGRTDMDGDGDGVPCERGVCARQAPD